jgi:hypothetical protein
MFWHIQQRRPHGRSRSLLLAFALACVAFCTIGSGVAQAGSDNAWCNGPIKKGYYCTGPQHTLTSVTGVNEDYGAGCGGAENYGSFYCATPSGCHTYSSPLIHTPAITHLSNVTREMHGNSTWGTTGAPASCGTGGSFSSVGGPVQAATADIGVPVLDGDPVTAPADVAALVAGADPADARTFPTPHGDAWVLADVGHRALCVVADDAGTGYGVSCTPFADVRATGALSTFQDANTASAAGDVVIAVMPAGVDALTVQRADGSERTVDADDGVATVTLGSKDRAVKIDASPDASKAAKASQLNVRLR